MELSLSNTEVNKNNKMSKSTKSKKSKSKNEEEIQQISEHVEEHIQDEQVLEEKSDNIILEEEVLNNNIEDKIETELNEKTDIHKDEYIKNLDTIIESLVYINDNNLKDFNLTKDFFNNVSIRCKKIIKLNTQMTTNVMDIMLKENLVSLKNKDLKQNKPKKVINKENLAINKLMSTYPEVLKFLKLENDSMISRAQLIQSINSFVKKEKTANNPDIYVKGDNRCFNLIGELKVLFDFIKLKMLERGDLENQSEFPTNISYREIMKYLKYCFPEIKKK
jgi:hypothetical protein